MDVKVYEKEEVKQPDGLPSDNYYVPNVIDLIPLYEEGSEESVVSNFMVLDNTSEQECSLATIWQNGLDPVESGYGIHWSEAILGEIDPIQIVGEITDAVSNTSVGATVEFGLNGNNLTYTIKVGN